MIDTTRYENDIQSSVALPTSWNAGISISKGQKLTIALALNGLDYTSFSWPMSQPSLTQSLSYAAGLQYYPALGNGAGFLKHTYYRAGFRTKKYAFEAAGAALQEHAISAGVGFPIKKSASTINIGIEYVQRGNQKIGQLQENSFLLHAGFMLNDLWFRRNKID